jgi:hypothetical protein
MANSTPSCRKVSWKGRPGYCLANDLIELTTLTGGGSIAELRFRIDSGMPDENVLWEAPWPTIDPERYAVRKHQRRYGPHFVGKFLAGFTGHALCLDYFGAPSDDEIRDGLPLHGEAGVSRWRTGGITTSSSGAKLTMNASLPGAGLKFQRELSVNRGESVIYVRETVRNPLGADHYFHWTQHVTFGAPFMRSGESVIAASATKGMTWPLGYEGKSLLENSKEFRWPHAPGEMGTAIDLSQPFAVEGKGFVAAVLTDPERPLGFFAVLNRRLGLIAGYCFSRRRFPWIAIWEENCARQGAPWNGNTRARGLEFGTTPMPLGKEQSFLAGSLFETPTFCRVPANGELKTGYVSFVAAVGKGWSEIRDVQVSDKVISIFGDAGRRVEIAARKLKQTIV